MMIHAYQETYLNKAQAALGDAFDHAINTCGIPGQDFIKLFIASCAADHLIVATVFGTCGFFFVFNHRFPGAVSRGLFQHSIHGGLKDAVLIFKHLIAGTVVIKEPT